MTLNRPEKLNAITIAMNGAVIAALDRALADADVRVIVLAGAGRAFSAGHDLQEEVEARLEGAHHWLPFLEGHFEVVKRLWACRKPLVAAVHGHCVGGGFEFALACDILVCDESARFGHVEIRYGSGPVTLMLPFLVHEKAAREMLLTGRTVEPAEAMQFGFVNRVVSLGDLDAAVSQYVASLAPTPPEVMALTKLALARASEAKGLMVAVQANLELSAILNSADVPEQREFDQIASEQGLKAALAWRDARYAATEGADGS
ncbi:MAG: enoyl-CoA hydratase/isomerase family protein [Anaerolineaceae bacterium]